MQQLEVKAPGKLVATHAAGGYQPGRILVVNCTVSWPWGSLVATLDWDPQLPDGWTLGAVGGDIGTPRVEAGKIVFDLAAQAFMSPLSFAYAVNVPPNASGSQTLRGVCHYTLQGQAAAQTMADPNPLVVVQRETVTAWQFRFLAANANQPELVIGMQEGATLEFDSGMDVVAAEPPLAGVMGGACVRTPTDQPLAIDHHAIARTGEWTLEVRANRQSVILSWNSGQIPAGTSLEFHEVDASMRRVAGTWRNLSRAGSLTVPVHTKCWFKVKFDHPEFVLNLAEGWNFVSLPIEPSITDAATLFSEIMQENAGTPVNTFGPLISGFVWAWQPGRNRFVSVSEVHALSGYWVYAPTALAIRFEGTPADPTVPLVKGFNTIGVPAQMALPANVSIGPVWWWDAIAQEYKAIPVDGKAVPGVGYWLYAPKPVVLHLDQ
jgi:hypothetical protein